MSVTGVDRESRSARVYGGLTSVQVFALCTALATSPIVARALGPEGRGLLAAVQVPTGLAPYAAQLGLGAYAVNQAAKGVPARVLLGSLGLPLLLLGLAGTLLAAPIAALLVGSGSSVFPYLTVGLGLLPVSLLTNLVLDVLWGEQRWRPIIGARLLVPAYTLLAIVALSLTDNLTVASASVVVITSGLVAVLRVVPELRRMGAPTTDRALRRRGLSFGVRAWGGTLANLLNQRLDQLIMIPLVPARELGLYAVAVTIASLTNIFTSQIITVFLPRIAAGEAMLVGRALRSTMLIGLVTAAFLAAATLVALTAVFGNSFAGSRSLVLILLVAYVLLAGAGVLGQALAAGGRPGASSLGELGALVVTVPGLVILLPPLGATGAALVSAAAYGTSFIILVVLATRHFAIPVGQLLAPRTSDFGAAWREAARVMKRVSDADTPRD